MPTISLQFAVFLTLLLVGYWALRKSSPRLQNLLLLFGSYLFYGWGEWRFLAILVGESALTWWIGGRIGKARDKHQRKIWFVAGITVSLGALGFFKYYDFFASSTAKALGSFGLTADIGTLNLILPLGLSYFSLKAISYLVEVYHGRIEPSSDPVAYFLYLSFFPQIVAGPIDRPTNLLNQLNVVRGLEEEDFYSGLKLATWGLFKKAVIADNLAPVVARGFSQYASLPGMELLVTAGFFSIQMYCDFSGYSDIANGIARLFGIKPVDNFAQPYFSRDIAEFWRRWHISLTSWFRDYVFYPLGGGVGSRWKALRNTILTFTLSGLWHGANWTFVVWGFVHGLLFVPILMGWQSTHVKKVAYKKVLPNPLEVLQIGVTFALVTITMVIFRAESLTQAVGFLGRLISNFRLQNPHHLTELLLIAGWLIPEWIGRGRLSPLHLQIARQPIRWAVYALVVAMILLRGQFGETPFIYRQF